MDLQTYIDTLIAQGKCCFTLKEACKALSRADNAVKLAIKRLKEKRAGLASPARGFYVIVPPEYRKTGCLPAEYFLPYLMAYWKKSYYVGLLSAAAIHGATHQAIQVTQVVTNTQRPPIQCGKITIRFIMRKDISAVPVQKASTPQSVYSVSTPEATAMDLLCFSKQSGGLNHIATVLTEMAENIEPQALDKLLQTFPLNPWKQRLGYILEYLGESKLTDVLAKHLQQQTRIRYIPIMPGRKTDKGFPKNAQWKIIENAIIEPVPIEKKSINLGIFC